MIQKTEGIVLETFDFRETSVIATFYTRDFGKIKTILKGIRDNLGKFASTLEPFSYNEVIFYRKTSGNLYLVTECNLKDNFILIREDLKKTAVASYIIELLNLIMPLEDKNENIFDLVINSLDKLNDVFDIAKILMIFQIKLLKFSGFRPNLDSCVSCGKRILDGAFFSLTLGGMLCPRCRKKDLIARPIFKGTVASLLHIEKNEWRQNLRFGFNPKIKKELEGVLRRFLEFNLDKRPRSEQFI